MGETIKSGAVEEAQHDSIFRSQRWAHKVEQQHGAAAAAANFRRSVECSGCSVDLRQSAPRIVPRKLHAFMSVCFGGRVGQDARHKCSAV